MSLKKSQTPDASVAEDLTASAPTTSGNTKECETCKGVGVVRSIDPTVLCADCQGSGTIKA